MKVKERVDVEGFVFEDVGTVHVTYPDESKIDLGKINVLNIGIQHTDNSWVVTLITREAIQKLKLNITDDLAIVGFKFNSLPSARIVHSFLVDKILEEA